MSKKFLPDPKDLVFKKPTQIVTVELTKSSIEFFKVEAGRHKVYCQSVIRILLQSYADRFQSVRE